MLTCCLGACSASSWGNATFVPASPLNISFPLVLERQRVIQLIGEEFQRDLRAVGSVAGNLRGCGISFDNREEESSVGAVLLEVGEVKLEQTSRCQTGISVVRARSAALKLLNKTVIDYVTAFGNVQEQVDLLHIIDESIGPALDWDLCGGCRLRRWKGWHCDKEREEKNQGA